MNSALVNVPLLQLPSYNTFNKLLVFMKKHHTAKIDGSNEQVIKCHITRPGPVIEERIDWLGLRRGTFTCVGWQVMNSV